MRAISSTIALPAAGLTVQATGSYRSLFLLGGIATLTALVPLVGVRRPCNAAASALALGLLAVVPVLGLLVAQTDAHRADEWLYRAINGLGPGPELLWTVLDPHTRNYLVLIALAVVAAAVTNVRGVPRVFARVFGSARPRVGPARGRVRGLRPAAARRKSSSTPILNGHSWAHLNSFPSGHMAITAALAVAVALAFPRLRFALWAYIAAVAFTRVLFGAHFPLDIVAGTALGTASALLVAIAFDRRRRRPQITPPSRSTTTHTLVAVMPSHNDVPERALVRTVLEHVDRLVLVDDGSRPDVAEQLDALADEFGAQLVRQPEQSGKGSAVRAGIDRARGADAVLVIDADGQHPAEAIPSFVRAARDAELVIGDRFDDLAEMPLQRRLANRATRRLFELATGREVRDTQNGMRLLRGRALETAALGRLRGGDLAPPPRPPRGRAGRVGRYPGDLRRRSEARSGRADSAKVLWALVRPLEPATPDARPRATPSAVPASTSLA